MNTPPNKPRLLISPKQLDFKLRKEKIFRKLSEEKILTDFKIYNHDKENENNGNVIPSVINSSIFGRIVFEKL